MSLNAMIHDRIGPHGLRATGKENTHTHKRGRKKKGQAHNIQTETWKRTETQMQKQDRVEKSTQILAQGVTRIHVKAAVYMPAGTQRYTNDDIHFLTRAKAHTHTVL